MNKFDCDAPSLGMAVCEAREEHKAMRPNSQ